ncbi:ABC transporter ATP-binding protein [Pyruvatibacter mobilis]|uniref:ABC transporter ATP-binding protein n=1 Tax=Pyruvatibacter mobilis TaxID=1712261 RepID=UPI003D0CF543
MSGGSIAARGLFLAYGGCPVLDGAGLTVFGGEVVGVLGANGAGKSTLLRCLAGVQAADAGQVVLSGACLDTLPPRVRAQRLGYLPQRPRAEWALSVTQVAALGRLPHLPWWQGSETARRAPEVISALSACHLEPFANRPVDTLSGGEFARAMLARLLAGRHDVVIADEPVADLDPPHAVDVMRILAGEAARGAAVLVALHDLALADRFCDRVIVLAQGRVIAQGRPRIILEAGVLARAYGAPCSVARIDGQLLARFDGGTSAQDGS